MKPSFQLLGELYEHKHIPEWLCSKPIPVPLLKNKELPFIIKLENLENSSNLVNEALENFLKLDNDYRLKISDLVYENYKECLDDGEFEPFEINDNKDIWNYIYPQEIYIEERRKDKLIYIKIACECEWEEEHGLQLVFQKGTRISRISSQDGHLTSADAYNIPDSEDKLLTNNFLINET